MEVTMKTKELNLDEMKMIAGGDEVDDLYERDDLESRMKRFAIAAKRWGLCYEDALRVTIYAFEELASVSDIEPCVKWVYGV